MSVSQQPAQKLQQVDAWRLAKQGAVRELLLNPALLPRLAEFDITLSEPLNCSLHYRQNEGGEARLTAGFEGKMSVQCQHCLEPVALNIDSVSEFALLADDDSDTPEGLEPAICGRDGLNLQALIEDELLLLVPQSPTHPVGECEAPKPQNVVDDELLQPDEKPNPFAALAALKQQGKGSGSETD